MTLPAISVPPTSLTVHTLAHAAHGASPSAAHVDNDALGRARRLVQHLRWDWPAMDMVLAPPAFTAAVSAEERGDGTHQSKRRRKRPMLDGTDEHGAGLGCCFDVLPLPHEYHVQSYSLPSPRELSRIIPAFPLPSSATFRPPRPGAQRGKWIIPVHGPVLGCIGASGAWLAPEEQEGDARRFVEHRARSARKAVRAANAMSRRSAEPSPLGESTRSNSQERLPPGHPPASKGGRPVIARQSDPPPPPTPAVPLAQIIWTTATLKSLHKALIALAQNNKLGPISVVLHPSTLPDPGASPTTDVCFGDHYRVYVDLAYALNVRQVLNDLDLRIEPRRKDGKEPKRVKLLVGAQFVLVGDEGQVLLVA